MGAVTWKRETNEPLEHRLAVQVSKATLAELRRLGYLRGVSVAEVARGFILDGLERAQDQEADQ